MSIAFVQQTDNNFNNSSGATSEPLAYGSNNTGSDLLLCAVFWRGASITVSVTDTQGNSWSAVAAAVSINASDLIQLFYAPNCKAGANTVTAHFSSTGGTFILMSIAEYSGVNTLDQKTSTGLGNGSTASSGTTSATTQANELIIGYASTSAAHTTTHFTAGAGYTIRQNTVLSLGIEDKTVSSTGTQSATFSMTASDNWGCGIATFYQASGGPAPHNSPFQSGSDNSAVTITSPRTSVMGTRGKTHILN